MEQEVRKEGNIHSSNTKVCGVSKVIHAPVPFWGSDGVYMGALAHRALVLLMMITLLVFSYAK